MSLKDRIQERRDALTTENRPVDIPEDFSTGTAADVEEIMKKYDQESNTRTFDGTFALVVKGLMAAFSLYLVYMNTFAVWDSRIRRASFLGLTLILAFLLYPARKRMGGKVNHIPWYDLILMAVAGFAYFYFVFNYKTIVNHGTRISTLEIVLGVCGVLILMEACRRVVGLPILVVASCFILYSFGAGKTLKQVVYNLFYTTTGVIGVPIGVCCTTIVLFMLFGAFLEATGISDFFIQCANAIAGASVGGPAKVSVISSALCGMVSGSSVGNTVTTGSITIPLMKRTGYAGEFAGAVEAASSTGGQIMPPIMGAAAFLMAEMMGVSYGTVVSKAVLPAVLYFTGIFLMVHLEARKLGLKGLNKDELPKLIPLLLRKGYLLIPLIVLIALIINGSTMSKAAIFAILFAITVNIVELKEGKTRTPYDLALPGVSLVALLFSLFTNNNIGQVISLVMIVISLVDGRHVMDWKKFIDTLANATKSTLSVAVACGVAGIIAGVVTMTGLGQIFITAIVGVSNGNLLIALFLTMLTCIILGMGVPTTANYVIMATTCAPILITGMHLNTIAANMFVFYFGIVADITPPVALAAYAGSAIAKSNPMKTALNATRLAIAAFIIPYIFAMNPAMLFIDTNVFEEIVIVATSLAGMFAIAGGLEGFMMRKLNVPLRLLCIAIGLLMIYPEHISDILGVAALAAVVALQVMQNRREAAA